MTSAGSFRPPTTAAPATSTPATMAREAMLGANLLVLTIPDPADHAVAPAGREVFIEAPGREEHRFVLTGDDTVLVLVDGEPALGVDQHGPGRWYGEMWQRLHPCRAAHRTVGVHRRHHHRRDVAGPGGGARRGPIRAGPVQAVGCRRAETSRPTATTSTPRWPGRATTA